MNSSFSLCAMTSCTLTECALQSKYGLVFFYDNDLCYCWNNCLFVLHPSSHHQQTICGKSEQLNWGKKTLTSLLDCEDMAKDVIFLVHFSLEKFFCFFCLCDMWLLILNIVHVTPLRRVHMYSLFILLVSVKVIFLREGSRSTICSSHREMARMPRCIRITARTVTYFVTFNTCPATY